MEGCDRLKDSPELRSGSVGDLSRNGDRTPGVFDCPVCESRRTEFVDFNGRKKVRCGRCGSLERHRAVWIYFKEHTDLFNKTERRFLQIAPEACFAERFSAFFRTGYLTADLNMQRAMLRMDIMEMPYRAESFEIIYCSHVLEHVANYRQAIQELYRVLSASGWMVLLIPARTENKTFRFAEKSLSGHIWKFGRDFTDMLEQSGLKVRTLTVARIFNAAQIRSLRLKKSQEIFHCLK